MIYIRNDHVTKLNQKALFMIGVICLVQIGIALGFERDQLPRTGINWKVVENEEQQYYLGDVGDSLSTQDGDHRKQRTSVQ